jgi:large subunit ribosomal protein L21
VELTDVLAMSRDDGLKLGQPLVAGARVAATVREHRRAEKIIVFRKLRRKNYRRTRGHRQNQTVLRIEEILADGETFTPPKPELKKKVAPAKKKAAAKKRAKPAGEVTAENAAKPKAEAKKPAAEKNAPAKSESDAPAADTSKDEETS